MSPALRSKDSYVNFGFHQDNMVVLVSYANFIVDRNTYSALNVQLTNLDVATWKLG